MSPSLLFWGLAAVGVWWFTRDGGSNEDSKQEDAKLEGVQSELEASADDEKDIELEESGIHTLNVNNVDSLAVSETISVKEDAIQEVILESNYERETTLSLISQEVDQPMVLTEDEITQECISDDAGSSNCSSTSSNCSPYILNHSLFTVYDISNSGCKIRREVPWVQIQREFEMERDQQSNNFTPLDVTFFPIKSCSLNHHGWSDHHRTPTKKMIHSSNKTAPPSTPYKVIRSTTGREGSHKQLLPCKATSEKSSSNDHLTGYSKGTNHERVKKECQAKGMKTAKRVAVKKENDCLRAPEARVSGSKKKQQERKRQNDLEKKAREEELKKRQPEISGRKKQMEDKKKQSSEKVGAPGGRTQHRQMWHV